MGGSRQRPRRGVPGAGHPGTGPAPRGAGGLCLPGAGPRPAPARPAARSSSPTGSSSRTMFGYAAYADRFAGDLAGVAEPTSTTSRELGVTYLHLMPLLQPRDGRQRRRLRRAGLPRGPRRPRHHRRPARRWPRRCASDGISLVPRPGAQPRRPRARVGACGRGPGEPRYRDYFHVFPDRAHARRLRADAARGVPRLRARQLHLGRRPRAAGSGRRSTTASGTSTGPTPTCSSSSPTSSCTWPTSASRCSGSTRSRSLWKRLGTNCQNQPEVHALTQALRTVARIACPAVVFKAEAIVGAARPGAVPRAGRARRQGQRPRLPQQPDGADLVDAGHRRRAAGRARARSALPPTPSTATWITYVRCHDDIGWAIDDDDAAAVGLTGYGAPPVPVRLVRRRLPRLVGPRAGLPGQPRHRRPADQRHARPRWPAWTRRRPARRGRRRVGPAPPRPRDRRSAGAASR